MTRRPPDKLNYMGLDRGDIEMIFNRCDGWYRPWCIRVTTGHSDFGFMSSSALANRYSARMGDSLGGAFHVTYVENLPGIVRCGLVPGGIDGGNRLALHFGAFAPWDKMNVATRTTLRNLRTGDPIAIIYIPSATLARYGAGNGTFMVFDVIPFYEVKSIWIGKSNGGKCLEYESVKRAYSKCVENEICPGFVGSSQESAAMFLQNVAKIIEGMPETEAGADNLHCVQDMVDRACELFRENKLEEFDALTNEIRDEISKTIILNDETWEGLRCRICPSCATAIPTCFCVCLECEAQLISTGRFCIHISSDDEGGDHRPKVSERKMRLTTTRRRRKRVMGRKTIPKTTTWTRKDTHLVTCPKMKTVVGSTATMTWHHGILLFPSGWRSGWTSHARLNTWRDSSRCRCQRCGGCSRVEKRERSKPRSKEPSLAHTTTTPGSTPTLLRLIRKGSLCHQRNKRLANLRTFGPGPCGRWRSATNTSVIWCPNARGCTYSTNCGLQRRSSTSPKTR